MGVIHGHQGAMTSALERENATTLSLSPSLFTSTPCLRFLSSRQQLSCKASLCHALYPTFTSHSSGLLVQGQQWVRIVIIGQSFMLHQIRKMVGMAVAIMRGDAPASCIRTALQPKRAVPTPMAPDIGLFLDECYYDAYNTRYTPYAFKQ